MKEKQKSGINDIIEIQTVLDKKNINRDVWCIVKYKTAYDTFLLKLRWNSVEKKWVEPYHKFTHRITNTVYEQDLPEYLQVIGILNIKGYRETDFDITEIKEPTDEEISAYWEDYYFC